MQKDLTKLYTHEQMKAILWSRGDTSFKLHAGQEKIDAACEASKHLIFVAECARQYGKSSWGAWKSDRTARKYPGCSVRIATAFYVDIESFILPAFRWLLSDCPDYLKPVYQAQKGKWVYPNGSEIQLVGLDRNPNKIRGNRLRLVLLEEAGFSDSDTLRYAYESVIIPATTHEPDAKIVLISTPPESGNDHFFCQLADEAALKDAYIKLTIYDNPLLTPARIDELAKALGGKDSIAFRREMLCERIIDTRKAVIPEFTEAKHVMEAAHPETFRYLHRYESLDSGVRDQTVVLLAYYDFPRGKLVLEDEVVLQGEAVDTRRIAVETKKKEIDRWTDGDGIYPVYRRVSDNNNLILIADLSREHGLHFTPTSKDSLEAMVNKLRIWFQDSRIEINPRCKHLIGTLRTALWNNNRDDFKRSETFGHADALASLMYLVRNVDIHVNPIPANYGIDRFNTIIPGNPQRLSQAAKAFAETFGLSRRK